MRISLVSSTGAHEVQVTLPTKAADPAIVISLTRTYDRHRTNWDATTGQCTMRAAMAYLDDLAVLNGYVLCRTQGIHSADLEWDAEEHCWVPSYVPF